MADEQREEDFEESPEGWAQRWTMEFAAARKEVEKWHTQGEAIIKRFRDERDSTKADEARWNLFTSNTQVLQAMLYGQTPQVSVSRRFADANDDVARVAGEILERLLNTDIERDGDSYATAIEDALSDRLLTGFGNVRVRYVAEFETVEEVAAKVSPEGVELAAAIPASERKSNENVETDYINWKDQLWSPCRVMREMRWWAHRSEMSRAELIQRFGEKVGQTIPLNAKRETSDTDDAKKSNPWGRAIVWEIWSKEHKRVFWFVEGHAVILDKKDDPLGLDGFWPFPTPMIANRTTSTMVPRPDFVLAQDLYNDIDRVSTRIKMLQEAIRVAGVYDKASNEIKGLLTNTNQNQLIPVDHWAMFAEKGGVKGAVDWLPLDAIVNALSALRDYRREMVDDLFQVTGMSDIMRGQGTGPSATATEQGIKAKFGSVRVQRLQDDFARFASDVQKLKAEVIAKHFDPQTILQRCNCQMTPDAHLAPPAVELIKSGLADYRIQVKPEAVSLTDFAALKQERTEVITAMATFFTAAAPLAQQMPGAMPYLLQILQWAMAGLRGASDIEGVLDSAIEAAKQQAAQPPQQQAPDPKLQQLQLKGQMDMAKADKELQNDLVRAQADAQTEDAKQRSQMEWNLKEHVATKRIDLAMPKPMATGLNGGIP